MKLFFSFSLKLINVATTLSWDMVGQSTMITRNSNGKDTEAVL